MIKKNLFILFVFYFFVLQLLVAGLIWGEPRFYLLGGINLLAMLLVSAGYRFFTKTSTPSREVLFLSPEKDDGIEKNFPEEKAESTPFSESNIEYIKTKINRATKKQLTPASGLYRLLMFLLACVGFGGVLYLFWDTFDFIAVIIAAILMLLFLAVIFKLANLWRKNILCSGYVLFFLMLGGFGIFGLGWSSQFSWLETIKTEITTFIDGIKGFEADTSAPIQPDLELSGFLFEQTGAVIGNSLSGELLSGGFLSGEQESLSLTT